MFLTTIHWITLAAVLQIGETTIEDLPKDLQIQAYDVSGYYSGVMPVAQKVSNVEIKECTNIRKSYEGSCHQAQLLEKVNKIPIQVNICRLTSTVRARPCDTKEEMRILENSKPFSVSREECQTLIEGNCITIYRAFSAKHRKVNLIVPFSDVFASPEMRNAPLKDVIGIRYPNGTCQPAPDHNLYPNGTIEGAISVSAEQVNSYLVDIDGINHLSIPGEKLVKLNPGGEGHIFHPIIGDIFYNQEDVPSDTCEYIRNIAILNITLLHPTIINSPIVSLKNHDGQEKFLALRETISSCGKDILTTNQPSFLIRIIDPVESSNDSNQFPQNQSNLSNDQSTVINQKLDGIIFTDINAIVKETCRLNYANFGLMNGLNAAQGIFFQLSNEFFHWNNGAASYISRPVQLKAKIRSYPFCCENLPIELLNVNPSKKLAFLDPRTSEIKPHCNRRLCEILFPFYYYVQIVNPVDNMQDKESYVCSTGTSTIKLCNEELTIVSIKSSLHELPVLNTRASIDKGSNQNKFLKRLASLMSREVLTIFQSPEDLKDFLAQESGEDPTWERWISILQRTCHPSDYTVSIIGVVGGYAFFLYQLSYLTYRYVRYIQEKRRRSYTLGQSYKYQPELPPQDLSVARITMSRSTRSPSIIRSTSTLIPKVSPNPSQDISTEL